MFTKIVSRTVNLRILLSFISTSVFFTGFFCGVSASLKPKKPLKVANHTIKSKPAPFLISSKRVDKLTLGTSIKELYWNYPKERIQKVLIFDARGEYNQYEVLSANKKEVLFSIDPDCRDGDSLCIIKRIMVKNNCFKTAGNLKVGMFYKDLLIARQKLSYIGWYEGNLIAKTNKSSINIIFKTDEIPKSWYVQMNSRTLPNNTKIIGFMISGSDFNGYTYKKYDSLLLSKYLVKAIPKKKSLRIIKTTSFPDSLHKVVRGETLYSLSKKLSISIEKLLANNTFIQNQKIKVGDQLQINRKISSVDSNMNGIDPLHPKGPIAKIYLETKGYVFGSSLPKSSNDSTNSKIFNSAPKQVKPDAIQ